MENWRKEGQSQVFGSWKWGEAESLELLKSVTVVLLQPAVVGRPRGGESQHGSKELLNTGRRSMGEIMKQQLFSLILTHGWCGEATRWGIPPLSMSAAGRLNIKAARSNVLLMDASHVKGNQINQSVKPLLLCVFQLSYTKELDILFLGLIFHNYKCVSCLHSVHKHTLKHCQSLKGYLSFCFVLKINIAGL